MLLNCYVGSVLRYRNATAVTWGRGAKSGRHRFTSEKNFDVKIIKSRDTRPRGISSGIIIWALPPPLRALVRDTHETRRIFSQPCRGSDRSMDIQECERAGFFLPYGRLALRFFRELHNQHISSLIIPQAWRAKLLRWNSVTRCEQIKILHT